MMKSISTWKQELTEGAHAARLAALYCCTPDKTPAQAARYTAVLDGLETTFGAHTEAGLYSAPGRTEIGGNHTDHQHGRVLAGSVNIDMIAAAAPNSLNQLRVQSEGYDLCVIDLDDLTARKEEENTTASLLRGECEAFRQRGAKLSGLDVYISSNVPKGSGVSSSAAFEVLVGVILNDCFMAEKVSPIAIAQIGQWAENVYFGKPCGLMDQASVCLGGLAFIDFAVPEDPVARRLEFDFEDHGYALCLVDVGSSHADLTDAYAAMPQEMQAVAAVFGKKRLCEVDQDDFDAHVPELRRDLGDRAVLRAIHYWRENELVDKRWAALNAPDIDAFLACTRTSGASSAMFLQNVSCDVESQPAMVALGLAERVLDGRGATRIHGGGFGGTIQCFVPLDLVEEFSDRMDAWLGAGSCRRYRISDRGAYAEWE